MIGTKRRIEDTRRSLSGFGKRRGPSCIDALMRVILLVPCVSDPTAQEMTLRFPRSPTVRTPYNKDGEERENTFYSSSIRFLNR